VQRHLKIRPSDGAILGSFYAPDQAAAIVAANKHLFVVGFGMSVWIYP
jgi:hypothetical protein